jgi:predicted hydrolase (HD superfamily)
MTTLADRALGILHEWVSESLRKHCYAVADSMRYFAQLRGADEDPAGKLERTIAFSEADRRL